MACASSPTTVHASIPRPEGPQYVRLNDARILVLVDEHMIEACCQHRAHVAIENCGSPVQQQVLEVKEVLCSLPFRKCREDCAQAFGIVCTPREEAQDGLLECHLTTDDAGIDGCDRLGAGKPMADIGGDRCANQTDQVADIARIEHTESLGQAERRPVPAQNTMGDRVERPRFHPPCRGGICDLPRPANQFRSRTTAERDEKNSLRRHPVVEQPRQSAHQRPCLAGTGTGHDQQRATLVVDGLSLRLVEPVCPLRGL